MNSGKYILLFFGQLTSHNSLHDICVCLKAHKNKWYHLGIQKYVTQSTLSRGNQNRDYQIFSDFDNHPISKIRLMYNKEQIAGVNISNEVFALDSTTISLSLKLFSWTPGKYAPGAVKIHTLLDLRGSIPAFILSTDSNSLDTSIPGTGSIYVIDKTYIDFAALYNIRSYGAYFITRAKTVLDFSIVESNFNIRMAICTYLIVTQVKHTLKSMLSIYETIEILRTCVFDKTPLIDLPAENQKNQNVKEQKIENFDNEN